MDFCKGKGRLQMVLHRQVYTPGETVQGSMKIRVSATLELTAIRAQVICKERGRAQRRSFLHFIQTDTLFGHTAESGRRAGALLQRGSYTYDFQIALPPTVPPSFVYGGGGSGVEFAVRALVAAPGEPLRVLQVPLVVLPIAIERQQRAAAAAAASLGGQRTQLVRRRLLGLVRHRAAHETIDVAAEVAPRLVVVPQIPPDTLAFLASAATITTGSTFSPGGHSAAAAAVVSPDAGSHALTAARAAAVAAAEGTAGAAAAAAVALPPAYQDEEREATMAMVNASFGAIPVAVAEAVPVAAPSEKDLAAAIPIGEDDDLAGLARSGGGVAAGGESTGSPAAAKYIPPFTVVTNTATNEVLTHRPSDDTADGEDAEHDRAGGQLRKQHEQSAARRQPHRHQDPHEALGDSGSGGPQHPRQHTSADGVFGSGVPTKPRPPPLPAAGAAPQDDSAEERLEVQAVYATLAGPPADLPPLRPPPPRLGGCPAVRVRLLLHNSTLKQVVGSVLVRLESVVVRQTGEVVSGGAGAAGGADAAAAARHHPPRAPIIAPPKDNKGKGRDKGGGSGQQQQQQQPAARGRSAAAHHHHQKEAPNRAASPGPAQATAAATTTTTTSATAVAAEVRELRTALFAIDGTQERGLRPGQSMVADATLLLPRALWLTRGGGGGGRHDSSPSASGTHRAAPEAASTHHHNISNRNDKDKRKGDAGGRRARSSPPALADAANANEKDKGKGKGKRRSRSRGPHSPASPRRASASAFDDHAANNNNSSSSGRGGGAGMGSALVSVLTPLVSIDTRLVVSFPGVETSGDVVFSSAVHLVARVVADEAVLSFVPRAGQVPLPAAMLHHFASGAVTRPPGYLEERHGLDRQL